MIGLIKKFLGRNKEMVKEVIAKGAIIVDVRTPSEYAAGNIAGSKNIPLDQIRSKIPEIKKWKKPVVTVCRSGGRSSMASSILTTAGIETINGGAWNMLQKNFLTSKERAYETVDQ